jgi:hypothetical protein
LIDPLVVAGDEDKVRLLGESLGGGSCKRDTIRAEVDNGGLFCFQTFNSPGEGFRLDGHSSTAAEGSIVDFPVFIGGPLAEVMGTAMEEVIFLGSGDDRCLQESVRPCWEKRKEVYGHL